MTEMDAKQNDINEGFRRFFSNIGLKLTVKRGSSEITTDVPDKTNKDEPNRPEDVEDTAKETKSDNAEQNTDVNIAQETYDNDSTTCPTLTDVTSEDVLENAEEKTTETKEEVKSDHAEETTAPAGEDAQQDAAPEEEPHSTFPSSPEEEVVVSPIKRFFTTGIFSGLRKKKKLAEDETTEKELVDMGKKEVMETTEQTAQQQQQQDKEEISTGVEAAAIEVEEGKSSSMDQSTITVPEPEILSSQEKDKVQASPLKRLLSGSSLKKLSKKQRSRKSSDAKLSDSGEHVSDQLLSSTESAENHKEEGPVQPSVEAAGEEDGAWASFKKLVTPKKRVKRSSLSNDETEIPGSVEEPKPSEGEQISDHSTEEGKKRKDSSVSWEAVLCGSGRRRSRKTSDSDDEMPQVDHKQESGSKHGAESPLESSNENEHEIIAASKQAGSPSEGDGGSTWKSLKRLVTPKRKAKDEDESKENIQSDNEVTQDESFSIKKLLPGRKKRKSAEKQDQISSDEADKDVPSGDEDSETPAVVPLSEFDTVETEVPIQTQADIEKKQPSTIPATNEEPDDLSESISKHQQLSDIPEEGIITETMATPASVAEEAARDDTIAEDLIEITSEAITAPEPASDITTADETEMISAVSQLSSESSKTSGNTTPVPVEYDIMETDTLLHQAVETISISPKALPVCSDDLSSERIVGSVSHQILETFVTEEATILEIHRRFDATAFKTGLSVEELEAINELSATPQTESISEVNDSVSTEIVSEVLTEEFNTAEIAEDEVHDVNLTHPEESIKELERFDEKPEALEAVKASTLDSEESSVQSLEKEVISEDIPEAESVTDEPKQTGDAVEVSVEGEKETELPDTETKTAAVEHAVLAEVVICNLKDVSVAIPDVLIEKTSEITEPLIETMASELEFKKEVEAATPLVKDDVTETAEEGSVVMMMHVPLVTFEDNHRIQVQVVDVNIKSAETIVDSVLEVGITEAKEVIDVCHETVEKVDNLSAMPEIEEEIINEENNVAIQEVIQHVKKNLPETISKPVVVNLLCQEVIEQPDAVTKVSEMVESESNEVEDQKVMDDSIGTFSERQDEAPAVISDDSATGQQVSEDLMQTPDILGSLDVSIDDHKEDLKETKAELKSSEVGVTAEEVKSEELDAKQIHEQAQITQIAQSQIVTPSNTGLVVPQNTGIISSIGNVESPSSLSLEFKLNIQFGQAKAPASPPPMMERIAPVKQTDVSEVGVQVVEAVEPEKAINPTQRAESQKQPELTEVAVQATEITEPAANSDSTERAMITNQSVLLDVGIQAIETVEPVEQVKSTETVTSSVQATEITEPATNTNSTERVVITNQPVLLDVGIHAMETVEPVEQIKSTETVTSSVHATKTIQPVRPTEKREVFLSQPVVSEACQASQETKAEEPVKQTEENDQDVWMDAEEVIYTQEETELSFHEVDEPPEPQTEIEQEEKAGLGHEVEMAPNFKTEEEESQQEMHKTGTCEVESEGEDFAVALEHLEIATASATTMELD
uniref:A kinase-anchoring proteins AKAP-5 and AKAP-12 calmodulin (CaM)-binding domain-containing protein n=1 Tax=Dicentrarchus labrax TaxID=13489 RepID=A0A8C4IB50_DICLA